MQIPLSVPDIGDAEKIELASWKVKAGDQVTEGQELCELVTDKAAFPLEAPHAGTIVSISRSTGDLVKVGEVLAVLDRA